MCALYAPVKMEERRKLWEILKDFRENPQRSLVVAGDFNNQALVGDGWEEHIFGRG